MSEFQVHGHTHTHTRTLTADSTTNVPQVPLSNLELPQLQIRVRLREVLHVQRFVSEALCADGASSYIFKSTKKKLVRATRVVQKWGSAPTFESTRFLFLFLAYSGLVYAAGRKKRKKNTLSTRGCSFC